MTLMNNRLAALAFGLAVVAAASPSLAQRSPNQVGAARAQALRTCSVLESKWVDYVYGIQEVSLYRACMAQHGQVE